LAGIIAGSFLLFRLWGHWWSFEPIFGFPSLHPKIPFPTAGLQIVHDRSGHKTTARPRRIIADSVRAP
jgi:hypothetical protein